MFHLVLLALFAGQAGPSGRQVVDRAAADRARAIYLQYCINCHGSQAEGTDAGPDLIRSVTVLKDRFGSEIGPALKKAANHPALSQSQIVDLSHFLKQRIEETARNRNATVPPNVLTGNVEAGRAYFNGSGKCSTCHSATGDLAGVAKKYDPVTLQQRFLFPRGGRGTKPVKIRVMPPTGSPVSGTLERVDDFTVSMRDEAGEYRSWKRTPDLKFELSDPYAAHDTLLDQYGDADMHNIVAYLETLK